MSNGVTRRERQANEPTGVIAYECSPRTAQETPNTEPVLTHHKYLAEQCDACGAHPILEWLAWRHRDMMIV